MDNDFNIDMGEVMQVVETAEVMVIRFALLDKRLLVDARSDAYEGPLVKVVERVGSLQERFRNLREMRPRFPLPDRITSFFWPKYVSSFQSTQVWERIRQRCIATSYSGVEEMCDSSMRELLDSERELILGALAGRGFQSMWEVDRGR